MATIAAPEIAAARTDTGFFGHPRGLSTLFFTELWERFSYYGMRAILLLFMTASVTTGGLGLDTRTAAAIYGMYVAMVYLAAVPGGWIADRFLGQRRATFWGGVLIMSGHICLALPLMPTFYLGLALIVLGTGLLKPNVSTIVGQLYRPGDVRRDSGFSIFYMGINLGGFISPFVCGTLAQSPWWRGVLRSVGINPEYAWHWGFGAAAVGMFLGLVQYVAGSRRLGDAGLHPAPARSPAEAARNRRWLLTGIALTVGVLALIAVLHGAGLVTVTPERASDWVGTLLVAVVVVFFAYMFLAAEWTPDERKRLIVITVLFVGAAVFWSLFEQAGSTQTLFADRNTRNVFLGHAFPSSWWQSLNSLFIIVFAGVFAWLWVRLGKHDPSSPAKFSIGLLLVAASFFILMIGGRAAAGGERVSPMYLLIVYLLQTFGELSLSPVGLSAMTKLAPARVAGLMMGVWFLAASAGNFIAARVAGFYGRMDLPTLFGAVGLYALAFAVLLALLVKPIKRMLGEGAPTG